MSNVLIGIIGVTLFIGLALASALFLGPRFQAAEDNATASQFVSAVSVVASAANSYRLATEYIRGADLDVPAKLVDAGFLKSLPDDPLARQNIQMEFVDTAGVDSANASDIASWSPRYVQLSLGDNQELCTMIARKVGAIASGAEVSTQQASISVAGNRTAGCFRSSVPTQSVNAGDYVVYARI